MNTKFAEIIFENPSVFIGEFLIVPLPSVAFAYALVRWLLKRNGSVSDGNIWRLARGILITDAISAAIRFFAIVTFAGRNAYELNAATGAMGVYYLLIPAVIAYAYLKLSIKQNAPKENNTCNLVSTVENVEDDLLFAQVAREMTKSEIDEGLWAKAFSLVGGDDKATKAKYIQLRFEKIKAKSQENLMQSGGNIRTKSISKPLATLVIISFLVAVAIILKKPEKTSIETGGQKTTTTHNNANENSEPDFTYHHLIPENAGILTKVNGISENGNLSLTLDNLSQDWVCLDVTVTLTDSYQHVDVLNGKRFEPAHSESYTANIFVTPNQTEHISIPTKWDYNRGYLVSAISVYGLIKTK